MQPTNHPPESLYPDKGDYNALEHFRRHGVEPGGPLYVTLDDVILFQGWAALAAVTVRLSLRLQAPDGTIVPVFYSISVAANGVTPTTKQITNLEGFILSATAETPGGLAGQVWIDVVLIRGVGTSDQTQGADLLTGYPSLMDTITFPVVNPFKSIDGRALANVVAVGNPAAGTDYSIIVPAGVNWLVRSIRAQLLTSAGVANRFVTLRVDDGAGNIFADLPCGAAQTASLTETYTWAPGLTLSNVNNANTGGLPVEMRLPGGFRIRTVTANIQAADQFSGLALELETFIAQ